MEHYSKFLKGIGLSALASVILYGSALAVPTPTYPRLDPGSEEVIAAPPATPASVTSARILPRTSNLSLARGTFRSGGASSSVASISTSTKSRSKARYFLPGMVLAALTPLVLHRSGDPGDQSVAVQTRTPQSGSLPSLNDGLLGGGGGGRGHGRGGNGDNGDNDHSGGGGNGDGEDNGDEVCDTGDQGGNGDSGDSGDSGDCEDNGGDNGGDTGGNAGGGDDHGGGGASLPEPGTVPLIGAGLMMALAFRSRRNR